MHAHPTIKAKILRLQTEVHAFLPSLDQLAPEQCRTIIQKYVAAIQGNFVNWMAAAAVSGRSVQARFAAEENIYVEMRDDHPGMLRRFAVAAHAEPTAEQYTAVEPLVQEVRVMVAEMSGAKNTALMGALESTSAEFIPFLAALAKKLGSSDFQYTDIHGEADVEHADQFLWALSHEQKHYPDFDTQFDVSLAVTLRLLRTIFTS